MRRKGIPKRRIGPEPGSWERSIRMRQDKGRHKTLDAAERSAYGNMSTSLCGMNPEMAEPFYWGRGKKREIKNEKEVMKENRQSFVSQVVRVRSSLRIAKALG